MGASTGEHCMYARALGVPFRSLPWAIRYVHADSSWRVLIGWVSVHRGRGITAWLAGWLFDFPPAMGRMPCRVEFCTTPGGERWWRHFGGYPMMSYLSVEGGTLFESFGRLKCELQCQKCGLALVIRCSRAWFAGIPLPRWLAPHVIASEKERDGRFLFRVSIRVPLCGLIAAYHGTLEAI